jgi:hypothetical protein
MRIDAVRSLGRHVLRCRAFPQLMPVVEVLAVISPRVIRTPPPASWERAAHGYPFVLSCPLWKAVGGILSLDSMSAKVLFE